MSIKSKNLSPSKIVFQRFIKNPLALGGSIIIIGAMLISILGFLITPDSSPDANEMMLPVALKKPGFKVKILKINNGQEDDQNMFQSMLWGNQNVTKAIPIKSHWFKDNKLFFEEYSESQIVLTAMIRSIELPEIIYGPFQDNTLLTWKNGQITFYNKQGELITESREGLESKVLKRIEEKRFLLGTDRYGRDMLSRLMIGTRVTLSVGLIAVIISLIIGIVLGSLAGFYRGWVDNLIMWFINVIWSVPTLLLVIAITLVLGKSFWQVFVAVGLTMWVEVARVVRGQIFSVREMEYVEAAKALGFKNSRIIFRHILPNIMGPVIVMAAANFASAILLEAGLSFLGMGAQPPTPSWGTMIRENYGYVIMDLAYLAVLPGLAIMLMVLAFNLVGNGLRDAFDSKEAFSTNQ